jgi:hypothetical protein
MNIINGALWFAYGLALRDWFIALPVRVLGVLRVCVLGETAWGEGQPTAAAA